jgi:hypothetical protein
MPLRPTGEWCREPCIIDLSIGRRPIVSFSLRQIYLGKSLQYTSSGLPYNQPRRRILLLGNPEPVTHKTRYRAWKFAAHVIETTAELTHFQ